MDIDHWCVIDLIRYNVAATVDDRSRAKSRTLLGNNINLDNAFLLCISITLPQGWETALIVGICIIVLQVVILGSILEPRIFNNTVGVHPIIIIFAIFAGIERFGILGALLAVPVAGVTQEIVIAYWKRYQAKNVDQFPTQLPQTAQPELEVEKLTQTLSEN